MTLNYSVRDPFVSSGEGASVLVAAGELDISSSDRLLEATSKAGHSSPHVILDLSAVTFIDCAALSALMHSRRALKQRGGVLTLRSPHRSVLYLLRLAALENAFPIVGQSAA
jgi:anti-sigma B factor antagonist